MSEFDPHCPHCGKRLTKVRYPSDCMYNRDQWETMIAGNWYCDVCPPGEGRQAKSGYRYYWDHELREGEG